MAVNIRTQRIAERIREEISEMLLMEITDPRLEGVTITGVTVDRELAYAKIYVSAVEGSARKDDIMEGFKRARGFLRYHLSRRIDLRSFPQLRFKWDPTPERAERIDRLIASLSASNTETGEKGASVNE
ncbi:MAG: 30S ribosome-binding factor RbfA [Anaerolineales bacterium]